MRGLQSPVHRSGDGWSPGGWLLQAGLTLPPRLLAGMKHQQRPRLTREISHEMATTLSWTIVSSAAVLHHDHSILTCMYIISCVWQFTVQFNILWHNIFWCNGDFWFIHKQTLNIILSYIITHQASQRDICRLKNAGDILGTVFCLWRGVGVAITSEGVEVCKKWNKIMLEWKNVTQP